jgi:hypothetical protein
LAVTVTVYRPGGKCTTLKYPEPSVRAAWEAFVSLFRTPTTARAITAPELSVTVPPIAPSTAVCAQVARPASKAQNIAATITALKIPSRIQRSP